MRWVMRLSLLVAAMNNATDNKVRVSLHLCNAKRKLEPLHWDDVRLFLALCRAHTVERSRTHVTCRRLLYRAV